jgi:hypothetical protein
MKSISSRCSPFVQCISLDYGPPPPRITSGHICAYGPFGFGRARYGSKQPHLGVGVQGCMRG